jgi:protein-S-isoprenylcysteine O-methyltransferase Ste14
MRTNLITLAVGLTVLVVFVAHVWGQQWTPMRINGAVIGLPSLMLLILARVQLGKSFSVGAKAEALVTHGLYSRIRNPIYIFGGLTVVGLFLFFGKPQLLWALAVIIPLQIYRAREEQRVLSAKFGDKYKEYATRTWF